MGQEATDEGIDVTRVESWFAANAGDVELPLSFERISGGRSNLTYAVTDATGRRWALRRPPLGKRLASAHDMGREFRIISALRDTPVPVAPAVGLAEGEDPFYVMEWVAGPILRSKSDGELFPDPADRRAIGERIVDTLVAIHAVDPDAVGLGELAKKEDYVARQLHRWQGQWAKQHTRELGLVDEVHDRLAARIPDQGPATIVHGDYRLDNMILSPQGEVAAVVDWELCTLGDPLADVGLLIVYWGEEDDELLPLLEPATMLPGFPGRADVRQLYAERSGRDLSGIDFYVALGLWKLAIILEGVFARYAAGQYGTPEQTREGDVVEQLVVAASDAVDRLD
jgi:aminoglycoside phosphotransferase (APT) family kinase protein